MAIENKCPWATYTFEKGRVVRMWSTLRASVKTVANDDGPEWREI